MKKDKRIMFTAPAWARQFNRKAKDNYAESDRRHTTPGWTSHWFYFETADNAMTGAARLDATKELDVLKCHETDEGNWLVLAWSKGAASHPQYTTDGMVGRKPFADLAGEYDGCEHNMKDFSIEGVVPLCEPMRMLVAGDIGKVKE